MLEGIKKLIIFIIGVRPKLLLINTVLVGLLLICNLSNSFAEEVEIKSCSQPIIQLDDKMRSLSEYVGFVGFINAYNDLSRVHTGSMSALLLKSSMPLNRFLDGTDLTSLTRTLENKPSIRIEKNSLFAVFPRCNYQKSLPDESGAVLLRSEMVATKPVLYRVPIYEKKNENIIQELAILILTRNRGISKNASNDKEVLTDYAPFFSLRYIINSQYNQIINHMEVNDPLIAKLLFLLKDEPLIKIKPIIESIEIFFDLKKDCWRLSRYDSPGFIINVIFKDDYRPSAASVAKKFFYDGKKALSYYKESSTYDIDLELKTLELISNERGNKAVKK